MQTERLTLDPKEARELYRAYKKHQHYSEPIDDAIRRTYQLIAQGRMVIRALESVKAAGLDAKGWPKLAICRADIQVCHLTLWRDGTAKMADDRWARTKSKVISFPASTFTGVPEPKEKWRSAHEAEAIVPLVPIHLRPKRGLQNYHILWEAEWQRAVPRDPMLLRRIGKGDMWLVVAAWDLTEIERAALSTRLNG